MSGESHASKLDRRAFFAKVRNHHPLGRVTHHRALQVVEPAEAYDSIYLVMAFEGLGTRLREASGHDYARVRVQPARAPHRTPVRGDN